MIIHLSEDNKADRARWLAWPVVPAQMEMSIRASMRGIAVAGESVPAYEAEGCMRLAGAARARARRSPAGELGELCRLCPVPVRRREIDGKPEWVLSA